MGEEKKNKVKKTALEMMHPTQMTVGMIEVAAKMEELKARESSGELKDWLKKNPLPAVEGPDEKMYITDHHHLGLALTLLEREWDANHPKEGGEGDKWNPYGICYFTVTRDFSNTGMSKEEFFSTMESLGLLHPNDENGIRHEGMIPKHLDGLVDDPYRSLAGFVRKAGGFVKSTTPFTEFKWADWFRSRIGVDEIKADIEEAVARATGMALSKSAEHLPGWQGVGGTGAGIQRKLKERREASGSQKGNVLKT